MFSIFYSNFFSKSISRWYIWLTDESETNFGDLGSNFIICKNTWRDKQKSSNQHIFTAKLLEVLSFEQIGREMTNQKIFLPSYLSLERKEIKFWQTLFTIGGKCIPQRWSFQVTPLKTNKFIKNTQGILVEVWKWNLMIFFRMFLKKMAVLCNVTKFKHSSLSHDNYGSQSFNKLNTEYPS